MDLIEEYRAAERADYVTWGGAGQASSGSGSNRESLQSLPH